MTGRTCKVLVVEDEPVVLDILGRMANALGRETVLFKTGLEALDWLSANPGRVDVALVDVILMKTDGFAIAQALERLHPEIRVILMSGYPESHFSKVSVGPGKFAYLEKPIKFEDLRKALGTRASHTVAKKDGEL